CAGRRDYYGSSWYFDVW
nr:immunoglobulin heavy chain junction region [Mus musculus]